MKAGNWQSALTTGFNCLHASSEGLEKGNPVHLLAWRDEDPSCRTCPTEWRRPCPIILPVIIRAYGHD
ncbi:hypothetical protein AD929_00170 [Gluconobacter potus]|uniref:Uncharacterized protein n=1 Tax=Gluconobacter potus TaxID=2724927 RepID=A0A149R473_9PROT|nr:hypothetical protein AD929_00170 [Gluconobacter potus]